jgi:tetratricopeptide (TPR) repeat protein
MMAVLCLSHSGNGRKAQAELCYREALRLGLSEQDAEILQEIGELYSTKADNPTLAIEAYEHLVKHHPKIGEAWQKLGDVASSQGANNRAIEAYKQAIELIEG